MVLVLWFERVGLMENIPQDRGSQTRANGGDPSFAAVFVQFHVFDEIAQVHRQPRNMVASPWFSRVSMSAKVRHEHEVAF